MVGHVCVASCCVVRVRRRVKCRVIELIEISYDHDLANNALRISSSDQFMSNIDICELSRDVVVTLATANNVYRLVLPHPLVINKVL